MKFLLSVVTAVVMIPLWASARSEGGMERYRIGGFYGLGGVAPKDVNDYINTQSTTPALGTLSSSTSYGGVGGYMLTQRFELEVAYDQESATNPKNLTAPSAITNGGVELSMNAVWAGLNFFLVDHNPVRVYVGGLVGYTTFAHASRILAARTEFDAQFDPIYQAQAGVQVALGKFVSLFAEGGYEYAMLGVLTSGSAANNLTNPSTGSNVNMDMTGWRARAGLNFHF